MNDIKNKTIKEMLENSLPKDIADYVSSMETSDGTEIKHLPIHYARLVFRSMYPQGSVVRSLVSSKTQGVYIVKVQLFATNQIDTLPLVETFYSYTPQSKDDYGNYTQEYNAYNKALGFCEKSAYSILGIQYIDPNGVSDDNDDLPFEEVANPASSQEIPTLKVENSIDTMISNNDLDSVLKIPITHSTVNNVPLKEFIKLDTGVSAIKFFASDNYKKTNDFNPDYVKIADFLISKHSDLLSH